VTFAAGLAADGMKPFATIYSTFLQRAYDQVVHDVAIQRLPVRFAMDRAGLVGADGPTHAGSFDVAYLGCLPGFVLMAAADEAELVHMVATQAALDDAQRNLDHTVVRAPMSGTATQVDNIQLGRFIAAGSPILSVIDDQAPWVEANPKETEITYLRVGQKVDIDIDTFPNHRFHGTVAAVSPGTGAQFSILPPQNATGNWVKVVQRVPVRIAFDKDEDTRLLRAGMSVNVDIDTGHSRLPSFLSAFAKEAPDAKK